MKALAGHFHRSFAQINIHGPAHHAINLGLCRPLSKGQSEELLSIFEETIRYT
jgi:hypothetical protein